MGDLIFSICVLIFVPPILLGVFEYALFMLAMFIDEYFGY